MIFFCLAMFALYFLCIIFLLLGWQRTKRIRTENNSCPIRKITIIVPFRNERKNIKKLLTSLNALHYPHNKYEIIGVDDHSTDGSDEIFYNMLQKKSSDRIIHLRNTQQGKKTALTEGVKNAHGEIIAVTDADCVVPSNWLSVINETFLDRNVKMAFGEVTITPEDSCFSAMQSMEFAGLMGVGRSAMGWGVFVLCSAANMAFLKIAFEQSGGYENTINIPSGDDMFLAEKMLSSFATPIRFYNVPQGCVMTNPEPSIRSFINQRLRWAGKWRYSNLLRVKIMMSALWFFQITVVALLIVLLFQSEKPAIGYVLWGTKIMLEGIFLFTVVNTMNVKWKGIAFLLLQLIYPFYVLAVGILANGKSYNWKGRKHTHRV